MKIEGLGLGVHSSEFRVELSLHFESLWIHSLVVRKTELPFRAENAFQVCTHVVEEQVPWNKRDFWFGS